MRLLALAAVAIALLSTPIGADPWVKAHRSGNADALGRLAASEPLDGLEKRIRSKDRATRLAALAAAPGLSDGWALLETLATAAHTPDRPMAVAAAKAGIAAAAALNLSVARTHDIPADILHAAGSRWLSVARRSSGFADVRVLALEIVTKIHQSLTPDRSDAALAMLTDLEPAVRRAALELIAPRAVDANLPAIAAAVSDADVSVGIAAAATLCGGIAHSRAPASRLTALGADRMRDIQRLVRLSDLSAAALLDAARCLAADGSLASRAALNRLRQHGPRSIRRRVARLRIR